MDKVVTEYTLVKSDDAFSFWLGVRDKIAEGYQPFGSHTITRLGKYEYVYGQAMVKYKYVTTGHK